MKRTVATVMFLLVLGAAAFICIRFYPYVFSKEIKGEIVRVERVSNPEMILGGGGGQVPPSQIFSFAVSIKDDKGEIHTASTEDRQWAVVSSGQCAVAKFFPYPPWNLEKSGTYYNARLLRLSECPGKSQAPSASPRGATPPPAQVPAQIPVQPAPQQGEPQAAQPQQ